VKPIGLLRVHGEAMGIAELIIGRVFARPVGSAHPTRYGTARPLALMRSPHHFHGVLDMAPLFGFFGIALALASQAFRAAWAIASGPCFSNICRAITWISVSDVMLLSSCSAARAAETDSNVRLRFLSTAEPEVAFQSPPYTMGPAHGQPPGWVEPSHRLRAWLRCRGSACALAFAVSRWTMSANS
jgi:hypothetical protein